MRCRLDRAVATPTWLDSFPAARVLHLSPIHGDHIPLLIDAFAEPPQPRIRTVGRFKFESFWSSHDGCLGAVTDGWERGHEGIPMFQAVRKITSTRLSLLKWQRSAFGNRNREIELIRNRLNQLLWLPLSSQNQDEHMQLTVRLVVLLEQERLYVLETES